MYLAGIKDIKNYRNLNGVDLRFSPHITYILGENNLGKTNISNMLKKIFNAGDFDAEDFTDQAEPISLECRFSFQDGEEGFFKDAGFDPNEAVLGEQFFDERSSYSCNNVPVHNELRRKICFISVSSDLEDKKIPNLLPSGKNSPIQYIYKKIVKAVKDEDPTIVNEEALGTIKEKITDYIKTLPLFEDLSFNHFVEIEKLVASILFLQEKSGQHIDNSGSGLRRRLHIILHILNTLELFLERNEFYIKSLISKKMALPLVICLDEPELHLHPHWQKQLIKELEAVFPNNLEALNISCQLIIITHSPYMISEDAQYMLNRLYLKDGIVQCVQISPKFDQETHDRFIDQFREAYYAKGILVVEGESDQGVLAAYNKEYDTLTKNSISVIRLNGAGNFSKISSWFQKLKIPVWGILDSDQKESNNSTPPNIIYSDKLHLEESIYELLKNKNLFKDCIDTIGLKLRLDDAKKQKNCTYLQDKTAFAEEKNLQQYRQKDKQSIFNMDYTLLNTDADRDFHKLLWVTSLANQKSAYEGKKLGKFLISNKCFPEYLINGVTKLVGKI